MKTPSTTLFRALSPLTAVFAAAAFLAPAPLRADDLQPLDDEFSSNATLSSWTRVHAAEGWNADQLATLDFGTSAPGQATLMPRTSTWYQDYRGELTYKNVTGDFIASTRVRATNRAGTGAPASLYSLAGILVRAPRAITPGTWAAGGENYLFLSLGCGDSPGTFQYERKTTSNSVSTLVLSTAGTSETEIQVARVGQYFIMSRRATGATSWTVHARYSRPDLPSTLQVGMTVYTDYPSVTGFTPFAHNSTVILTGTPDLLARFDWFRFRRPVVPAPLVGVNLTLPAVLDEYLLAFLGDAGLPVSLSAFGLD